MIFRFTNPARGISADFGIEAVKVHAGAGSFATELSGIRCGERFVPVVRTAPEAGVSRVDYDRGLLGEWYVNGPLGIEQGFRIPAPPATCEGEATVRVVMRRRAKAALAADGGSATLLEAKPSLPQPGGLRRRGASLESPFPLADRTPRHRGRDDRRALYGHHRPDLRAGHGSSPLTERTRISSALPSWSRATRWW